MSTTVETVTTSTASGSPGPWHYFRIVLKTLASLQLTVVLFLCSIGLVFFGTVAQMEYGIWTVVDQYFWSWYVLVPFDLFQKFGQIFFDLSPTEPRWTGSFPFPAGKLLGGAMLVNLIAAHMARFRVSWKRSGILLIHSGLILLFVGEFITREYAVEQQMAINEGDSVNYTQDTRNYELAFVRKTADGEQVTVIPQELLQNKGRISNSELPFDVEVVKFMKNASFFDPAPDLPNTATAGAGLKILAQEMKEEAGVETQQKGDIPALYLQLFKKGTQDSLGTFLVTPLLTIQGVTESLPDGDGVVKMSMRNKRYYKPFSVHLIEFRHDKYVGTMTPKNYSSRVVLLDPEEGVEREVVISMNSPLRYRGETFYQADFDKRTEKTTYLQVVRNPGWIIPYVSCAVVTLGMIVHFGIFLTQFLIRRAAA